MKKPVNLGFLDFITLERRHHFCRRELELNRRLCPEIYLAVIPIYEGDRGFSFDDAVGEVAEYAVKMQELPHGWFLNELLAKRAVGETEIKQVISRLYSFYESEAPRPEIEEWGRSEKLKISTDENFAQVTPFVGNTLSPLAFDAIRHFTNKFYVANERLFERRIQQHRVRDCHGDLRLEHIHLGPRHLSIYDCIEFNDRLRYLDWANDLAFLAMDFDYQGRPELADYFVKQMAIALEDGDLPTVVDFYKCYRAYVRGKVETIQSHGCAGGYRQES